MGNINLIKSEIFETQKYDFWQNENGDILMTREQIGKALDYKKPMKAIGKIHERHLERLEKYSFVSLTNGRNTYFYTSKGIYEICRWSRQPKADAFMDWVWDVIDGIRKGQLVVVPKEQSKGAESEAKLINAKVRQAKLLVNVAEKFGDRLSDEAIRELINNVSEITLGKPILPKEKDTYEKLKDYVAFKLDELEKQMGKMSEKLIYAIMKDLEQNYYNMDEKVTSAFREELRRKRENLN